MARTAFELVTSGLEAQLSYPALVGGNPYIAISLLGVQSEPTAHCVSNDHATDSLNTTQKAERKGCQEKLALCI